MSNSISMPKILQYGTIILLIVTALFLCFFNLSKLPLQQWDEQTNVDVVDESRRYYRFEFVEYITLSYRGLPFLEKPPLWYWTTMSVANANKSIVHCSTQGNSMNIMRSDSANYRIVSATSGFFLIMLIYHIGKKFWGHWGGIASGATMLATGHLFINNVSGYFSTHTFRSADLDAMQILFMMLSFWFFWRTMSPSSNVETLHATSLRKRLKILSPYILNLSSAFAFSALAVMTKGPFGILPIIIYLLFTFTQGIQRKFIPPLAPPYQGGELETSPFYKRGIKGILQTLLIPILAFILITAPWHLFMYSKFGQEFIDEYFLYHTLQRMTTELEEHHESWNFYIWMLFHPEVFAPTILLPISMILIVKKERILFSFKYFASIFGVLLPLLTFTLIQTKLAWYNLYAYPFAALCIGYLFSRILRVENRKLRISVLIISAALIQAGIIYNITWVLTL